MDPFTHALTGALVVRAKPRWVLREDLPSPFARTVTVAFAAVFPDIDYVLFWWDPYQFITHWHRGLTHSLVMAPFWSIMIGIVFASASGQFVQWKVFSRWCALGLVCHIAADIVTIYGTQIFAPISDYSVALNLSFDVDPWIGLIVGISLVGSYYYRAVARWGLMLVIAFLITKGLIQRSALAVAEDAAQVNGIMGHKFYAIPQPISPFHWKLVVEGDDYYKIAYVDLLKGDAQDGPFWLSAYKSKDSVIWDTVSRFGEIVDDRVIAKKIWNHGDFANFRRFAKLPAIYRIDRDADGSCVWFTDLRHILPGLLPPFRYGMCRLGAQNDWHLYRIKRFTENTRQPIANPRYNSLTGKK